jgi:transcriptional regulator with XRE-family HTH domain
LLKKIVSTARPQRLINALIFEYQKTEGRRVADRELARYLQVQPGTLSKWRNGKTKLDQVEWLLRLLDRLPEERWRAEIEAVLKETKNRRAGPPRSHREQRA